MVRISYIQKPYRKTIMRLFDADIVSSPSKLTEAGKRFIHDYPHTTGSLGMAIAEAIEVAVKDETTKYSIGSVLNHVLLHQTVIGLEVKDQLRAMQDRADIVIGCCGGGSNFAGFAYPLIAETLEGKADGRRYIGVEPDACASMTRGVYRYDYGDTAKQTPLLKMETLGCEFVPDPIYAGGLRYHGIAPSLAFLHQKKLIEARSYDQLSVFQAAQMFAHTEGVIPAPETSHAIRAVIDEAVRCREQQKERAIVFNFSGHGLLDLGGYEQYLDGNLES